MVRALDIRQSTNEKTGTTVYCIKEYLERGVEPYELLRTIAADVLDIDVDRVPSGSKQFQDAVNLWLGDECPDRFSERFIGFVWLNKYQWSIHQNGTVTVRELDAEEMIELSYPE